MAGINRNGSPMDICDEGLDEAPGIVEKRKRDLKSKQQSKSRILSTRCCLMNNCYAISVTRVVGTSLAINLQAYRIDGVMCGFSCRSTCRLCILLPAIY